MKKKGFIVLEHGRTNDQIEAMKRIDARGECPFCFQNLSKEHKKPILRMGNYWTLTESQFPYKEAQKHLLLIYRQHVERISDIDMVAGTELINMLKWVEVEYNIKSGSIGFRFGDPKLNGGSVNHLHVHVLVPKEIDDPTFDDLKFRMSAKKK